MKTSQRASLVAVIAMAVWVVIGARLVWLQVVKAGHFRHLAQRQHQFRVGLMPERGTIFDRQGRPLTFSVNGRRSYPYGTAAAQTLGVVGRDGRGLEGLELLYDDLLRGQAGWTIRQLDARGRSHPSAEYPRRPAQSGGSVILTIDADYQSIVQQELERGAAKHQALSALAIVTDPATGEILAVACYPPVQPDRFAESEQADLVNKAISEQFEPGSTFKAVTMAAAIEEGTVAPEDILDGEDGSYSVGGHNLGEAEGHRYGRITVGQALAYSSNICLVKIGERLGREKLYQYARAFGFGCKTGIEFPGEAAGVLTKPSGWSLIQSANISFGQGLSVTGMQLAAAYGAIANGGYLLRPRLVRALEDPAGGVYHGNKTDTLRRVISKETSLKLTEMLSRAVNDSLGTGRSARIEGWNVAGKTGTGQRKVAGQRGYAAGRYTASFVGFMPSESPRLLAVVVVNEPKGGHYGGRVAAPICRNIFKRAISLPRGVAPELLASGKPADEAF
ncbi:MAG TPA: penicillin-binding protein 2 [candidate division Zixibacteria bacterium]|nr:penicillin-binding protein 2 [candidate division Zixibacteria bacterium]